MKTDLKTVGNDLLSLTTRDGTNIALKWNSDLADKALDSVNSKDIPNELKPMTLQFLDRMDQRRTVVTLAGILGLIAVFSIHALRRQNIN